MVRWERGGALRTPGGAEGSAFAPTEGRPETVAMVAPRRPLLAMMDQQVGSGGMVTMSVGGVVMLTVAMFAASLHTLRELSNLHVEAVPPTRAGNKAGAGTWTAAREAILRLWRGTRAPGAPMEVSVSAVTSKWAFMDGLAPAPGAEDALLPPPTPSQALLRQEDQSREAVTQLDGVEASALVPSLTSPPSPRAPSSRNWRLPDA